MSKWYLLPAGVEFSAWVPSAIAKHIAKIDLAAAVNLAEGERPGSTTPQTEEPTAAIHMPNWSILPLTDNGPTLADYQRVASRTIQHDGQTATAVYTVEDKPLEEYKAERKAVLADLRWQKETAGVLFNGVRIATDDRSKTLLNGKYRAAEKNPNATHRWKTETGEVVLDSATIIAIGDAVEAYVQSCFDRELDLIAEIDATQSPEAVAAIDINGGW